MGGSFVVCSGGKSGKDAADDRDQLDLDSIIGRLLEVCLSLVRGYRSINVSTVCTGRSYPYFPMVLTYIVISVTALDDCSILS